MCWNNQRLNDSSFEFIEELPEQQVVQIPGTSPILVVHGSPRSATETLFPDKDSETFNTVLSQVKEPVLICGHTHRTWKVERNGKLAVNPGAICGPLNGEIGAQYALLNWKNGRWEAELYTIQYDFEKLHNILHESNFIEEAGPLARAIMLGHLTGQDIYIEFINFAYALAKKANLKDIEFVPDEIWEQAEETFDWAGAEK